MIEHTVYSIAKHVKLGEALAVEGTHGSFSALVFADGEMIINPNVQTQFFVTGGLGLAYGF